MIISTRVEGQTVLLDLERMKFYGVVLPKQIVLSSLCEFLTPEEYTELGSILRPLLTTYHCDLTHFYSLLDHNMDSWADLPIVCTLTSYNKELKPVNLKIKGVKNIAQYLSNHPNVLNDYDIKIES